MESKHSVRCERAARFYDSISTAQNVLFDLEFSSVWRETRQVSDRIVQPHSTGRLGNQLCSSKM